MEIKIDLYSLDEFEDQNEETQTKVIFTAFGILTEHFVRIDRYLVFLMEVEHLNNYVGSEVEALEIWEKKLVKFNTSTLGTIFKKFKKVYEIGDFEEILTNIVKNRNFLMHTYFRDWGRFENAADRYRMFLDMLSLLALLEQFFQNIELTRFLAIRRHKGKFEVVFEEVNGRLVFKQENK